MLHIWEFVCYNPTYNLKFWEEKCSGCVDRILQNLPLKTT